MQTTVRQSLFVSLLLASSIAAGCVSADKLRRKQLENVAKDWSLTIRASQVIPVYPLTEDIQPGDVFLVDTPLQQQARAYEREGFLPLDQHLTRLKGFDYAGVYMKSHGVDKLGNTPQHWKFPPDGIPVDRPARDAGGDGTGGKPKHLERTDWHKAPRAAFPSYSFSVASGRGLQMALPVQGIPVGLSIMKADSAVGSVTISDAYTYGMPYDKLVDSVRAWASLNRSHLASIARENNAIVTGRDGENEETPAVFLRVINRVYLTGSVVISMRSRDSIAAQGEGGAPQGATLPSITDAPSKTATARYADSLKALSQTVNQSLPGGEFQIAWATDRSVALSEIFERPLVVGYLGFDFPVFSDGHLGTPVATRDQLLGQVRPFSRLPASTKELNRLIEAVKCQESDVQAEICDEAAASLPEEFRTSYASRKKQVSPVKAFEKAYIDLTMSHGEEAAATKIYDALLAAWEGR